MKYNLIATAAMGLESLVADEIRALGYECTVDNAKVMFQGDESAIARTNLWLRTSDRVKIVVGEFKAFSFDELFEKTKALPWEDFVEKGGFTHITGKSQKSKLYSVPDCQSIVKKAIVERLKSKHGSNNIGMLVETGATYKIEVAILKDKVTLTIDTTGPSLHKRGYRVEQGEAPLKETLAASLVLLTKWTPDRPFVDPFCGSGTIAIEAALIGQNIAPGFNREFSAESWAISNPDVWDAARDEADSLANYDQALDIMGCDIDHKMVEMAIANAEEAGFGDLIDFKQMQATDLVSKKEYGVIVGNPPYGERIGDDVEKLYANMGKTYEALETWSKYFITSFEQFEEHYGKPATKKRKLYNGQLKTDFYQYWGPRKPRVRE